MKTIRLLFRIGVVVALLVGGEMSALIGAAQPTYFAVPDSTMPLTGSSSLGPVASVGALRYIGLYTPVDIQRSGLPDGAFLTDLRFYQSNVGSGIAASGMLRVWLVPTTDTVFQQRNTSWATLLTRPDTLRKVYEGSLVVPFAPLWYGVSFNTGTPLTHHTGLGYYVAWEWENTAIGPTTAYLITTGGSRSYYG